MNQRSERARVRSVCWFVCPRQRHRLETDAHFRHLWRFQPKIPSLIDLLCVFFSKQPFETIKRGFLPKNPSALRATPRPRASQLKLSECGFAFFSFLFFQKNPPLLLLPPGCKQEASRSSPKIRPRSSRAPRGREAARGVPSCPHAHETLPNGSPSATQRTRAAPRPRA